MANVIVDTNELKKAGNHVKTICENIENSYNAVMTLNVNLESFKSFQNNLAAKNKTFNEHSHIFNIKITECADKLEKEDNSIGSKTISLESTNTTNTTSTIADNTKINSTDYTVSSELDYTFDSSNYNISAEELYAKAETIRNSNLPINIKIVNAAKLFHEYTMTWTYSSENLIYERGYEATIEDPNKRLCCATGVANVLYLAGANTTDEMRVEDGKFNPHWQHNIERLARKMNWEIIPTSNLNEIQPGDIMMTSLNPDGTYGHVEIYAGNNYVYNWGNTYDIQAETAKHKTPGQYQAEGAYAIRVVERETV